jgi:hypothetical protein
MVEAQREGRGIKGKTEGRNGRGPEGRKGNKKEIEGRKWGRLHARDKEDERRVIVIHEVLEWQGKRTYLER